MMYVISAILLAVSMIFYVAVRRKNIVEWLVCMCAEAEMTYGSGTGYLKLRDVYDEFVKTFPLLGTLMPFGVFSRLVDEALDALKEKLKENEMISEIVTGV